MNRGLKYYGIMLIMIATLVFTLNDFGVVNATTSVNQNNSTQINPLNDLISDSSGLSTCDECVSNSNNGDNDNNNNNNNNNDNNNDDEGDRNNNGNNGNNNDDNSDSNNDNNDDNNNDGDSGENNDDVPMSLPFNSNLADESDDEKDYSSAIPFP